MQVLSAFFTLCLCVNNVLGQGTIIDVAKNLGANTLLTLITDAGLTETLESDGPYTLFAPTDDAFSKVPQDVLNNLKNNKTLLTEVLQYHVIGEKVLSSELSNDMTAPTLLENKDIRINVYESRYILKIVTVNGCTVIKPDQLASNGVVHVIDKVIYPIPSENMIEYVINRQNLQTLAKGFSSAGILDIFEEGGPFTLFAPTDEAFQKLPEKTRHLLQTNITYLKDVLTQHILDFTYYSAGFYNSAFEPSIEGRAVIFRYLNGKITLDQNVNITEADIPITNGVVYIIDGVLNSMYPFPPPGK